MNRKDREELLLFLEEKEQRVKYNKIKRYYPEKGPLRRELYPKHMKFFEAGKYHQERAAIAGNRCITPWTFVDTEIGPVLSAKAWTSKCVGVLSLASEVECITQVVDGHFRGIEQAFRLVLDTGQFFDCSRKHQLLTNEGWISLDQLMSLSNGLRLWQKLEDYQANCVKDGYLCDQQLPLLTKSGQELSPSRDDVRKYDLFFELTDEVERKLEYIRAYQQHDRLSTHNDLIRFEGLFELFSAAFCDKPVLQLSDRIRSIQLLLIELSNRLQSCAESDPSLDADVFRLLSLELKSFFALDTHKENPKKFEEYLRSLYSFSSLKSSSELFDGAERIAIFYPYSHPFLIGGRKIISIVPIGLQPIIDAHIPVVNNYKAAGVYHHNCGKTTMSCYETTLHLTGDYPEWWQGYRFNHPVDWWAASDTTETTRDILQHEFLGQFGSIGTGLIPKDCILGEPTKRRGIADAVDTVFVKHKSGGQSVLSFKSYDQGREKFQGTAKHGISLDEEPDESIYFECLTRLMTTNGLMICTFTPLKGMSGMVMRYLYNEDKKTNEEEI